MGMAKPSLAVKASEEPSEAAVSRPITWPAESTSGPPESPGRMLASVAIRPSRCSEVAS